MFQKEPHRTYSLIFHALFVVKYRQEVFREGIGIIEDMKDKIRDIAEANDVTILEIECGVDHIHFLMQTKPTLLLTKFINVVKGHSSRHIRKKYATYLKTKLWGDSFWSRSYFIATTGNVSIDRLKQYIEGQRAKPANED